MRLPYVDNTDPLYFRRFKIWEKVSREEWTDWKWQMKNTITTGEELQAVIPIPEEEKERINSTLPKYKFAVTPYWTSLIDVNNPECPFKLQAVPMPEELVVSPGEFADPLGEDVDSPVPGLTHRCPDRVLVLIRYDLFALCAFAPTPGILDKEGIWSGGRRIASYIRLHPGFAISLSGGAVVTGSIMNSG
jgi:lysine 2,3-aminomutase